MKTHIRLPFRRPACVTLAAALVFSSHALAQITVTTLADENDIPAGAQVSLREALRDSADGGQITLDATLAGGALVLTSDELLVLGKTVSIDAPGGLVIDGRGLSRLFSVGSGAGLNLTGVTLQNGRPRAGGGGAILSSGTLTLTACVLRDNRAAGGEPGGPGGYGGHGSDGGAIHNTGSLSALRCHFINNFAGAGGGGGYGGESGRPGHGGPGGSGGAILISGPLQLTECTFSGNASGGGGSAGGGASGQWSCGANGGNSGGGGAVSQSGNLTVERCTFYGNSCPAGGQENHGGTLAVLSRCEGYAGSSGSGAAVSCEGGIAVVTNSTFVANTVGGSGVGAAPGGAIRGGSQLRLVHCTITANSAASGFRPYASQTAGIAGSAQCENCIVSGNMVNSTEINFSPGVQPVLIPPNSPGTTAGVNLQLSPLSITSGFLPVLVPHAGSPALNAGAVLIDPPATDERGFPRAVGAPDLGAVEVQAAEPALRTLQSITFSPPEIALSSTMTLTAWVESGLVSFELVSGPATLSGNTLTFTGVGFAAVRASQSGNAGRAPALPLVRIIESPRTQTIAFTPAASYVVYTGSETTVTLPATTSAGLPITWTFLVTPGPGISLSGNMITATAVGSIQIRGRHPGNAQHSALDFTWPLTFVPGTVQWNRPNTSGGWFSFVEGSPHGATLTVSLTAPHTAPLPVPSLPAGLVATPSIIPAGQASLACQITLPADPGLTNQYQSFQLGGALVPFYLLNRANIPLNVAAPASMVSGVSTQVTVSGPPWIVVPGATFGPARPPDLSVRTMTVSAVDFDNPATSVPVTLISSTNASAAIITFPPMDRRVKLIITTDDGITAQSGPIQVMSDTNTDGDGIDDLVEAALQRAPDQFHPPPLTIERDATGLYAVLASRPLDLRGWTIVIEVSTDLLTWTPASAASTTVTPNPDGTTERVSVLVPKGAESIFVRLKAGMP